VEEVSGAASYSYSKEEDLFRLNCHQSNEQGAEAGNRCEIGDPDHHST